MPLKRMTQVPRPLAGTVADNLAALTGLPPSAPGMRIGLFGGSFNPIHAGHVLVMQEALRRLALDALWVVVTPGNPLKNHNDLAPLRQRIAAARRAIAHPRIRVTGFEAGKGFSYTWQSVDYLTRALPGRRFVWIMGADGLSDFHRWERWRDIAAALPLAIYARPGSTRRALTSRAAASLDHARLPDSRAPLLALRPAPAWIYLRGRQSPLSSSAIRAEKPPRQID